MPIESACQCGKPLRTAEEHSETESQCQQCEEASTVPSLETELGLAVCTVVSKKSFSANKSVTRQAQPQIDRESLDDFLSSELPPLPEEPPALDPAESQSCPGCQTLLPNYAVLCIDCGFNLSTGKKIIPFTYVPSEAEGSAESPRFSFFRMFVSRIRSWKLWTGMGLMLLAVVGFCIAFHHGAITSFNRFSIIAFLFLAGFVVFLNGLVDGEID